MKVRGTSLKYVKGPICPENGSPLNVAVGLPRNVLITLLEHSPDFSQKREPLEDVFRTIIHKEDFQRMFLGRSKYF